MQKQASIRSVDPVDSLVQAQLVRSQDEAKTPAIDQVQENGDGGPHRQQGQTGTAAHAEDDPRRPGCSKIREPRPEPSSSQRARPSVRHVCASASSWSRTRLTVSRKNSCADCVALGILSLLAGMAVDDGDSRGQWRLSRNPCTAVSEDLPHNRVRICGHA